MEETIAITPPPRFATRVGERQTGRGWVWPFTVTLHALGAAAVVIVPLLGNEPLPSENDHVANAFFVSPQFVAPPPPPPPPAAARAAVAPKVKPAQESSSFTAPIDVPKDLAPDSSLDLGIEGGVPGGVVGGVVGGIEAAPPPPAQVIRVGGVIREPKKVKDVAPVYPNIAKTAKIQGVVIIEAQISPQGKVEGVKVLRSIPTLDESAMDAVRQWVYTPTLIDGVPVSVIMTVTVNFMLRR
jgi:protein TonB